MENRWYFMVQRMAGIMVIIVGIILANLCKEDCTFVVLFFILGLALILSDSRILCGGFEDYV